MKTFKTVLQIALLIYLISIFIGINQLLSENNTNIMSDYSWLVENNGVLKFFAGLFLVVFVVIVALEGMDTRKLKVGKNKLEQEIVQLKARLFDKQEKRVEETSSKGELPAGKSDTNKA